MSRVHEREGWSDGMVLTPHELREELNELVGEVNGRLDRDNAPRGTFTSGKVRLDQWHKRLWEWDDATVNETLNTNTLTAVGANYFTSAWKPIAGMSGTIRTGQGRMLVRADLQAETYVDIPPATATLRLNWPVQIGILMDGQPIAVSASHDETTRDGYTAFQIPIVTAGDHFLQLAFRGAGALGITEAFNIDLRERSLLAIYLGR
jgi:hypothetical protein